MLLVAALGLNLFGVGCAQEQASHPNQITHYAARRQVTGSNVPQAPAYGDGVDDSSANQSVLGQMEQGYAARSGGVSGGAGMGSAGGH